ncbi:MAG: lycopene cyclase domain-containing protein [Acidimicrobiia bacterium]
MDLDRFQYLILMGGCLLITLPLEFVLGARVWRRPKRLVKSLAVPVAIFMAWDWFAVSRDHWDYNPRYVTGWELPGNLPVEELVFFIAIPICCLLTLEAVGRVLRGEVRLPRWRRDG